MKFEPPYKCPKCSDFFSFDSTHIIHYFVVSTDFKCPKCSNSFDLYDNVLDHIFVNFMNSSLFGFIGAKSLLTRIDLQENVTITYDLKNYGLPENSQILHINYTPSGNLWPLEWNSNEILNLNFSSSRAIRCIKMSEESNMKPELSIWTTYIDKNEENYESVQNLVAAFDDYRKKEYSSCIIPANVSVEFPLHQLMNKIFSKNCSPSQAKRFLTDGATYSYQLNVLYPYLASMEGFGQIPERISGNLNRLRSLRNDIAHRGGSVLNIQKKEMANILTSALFANTYFNYIEKKL